MVNTLEVILGEGVGGILGWKEMVFTCCTALKCFFRAELDLPRPAKPLTMVLMTSRPPFPPPTSVEKQNECGYFTFIRAVI